MAKGVSIKIGGAAYWLVCNAEAYFVIQEKYGEGFGKLIAPNTPEAYGIAVEIMLLLAEQGELCRRAAGYDRAEMLTAEMVPPYVAVSSAEAMIVKNRVMEALLMGMGREVKKQDKEIDLDLLEWQKKTEIS